MLKKRNLTTLAGTAALLAGLCTSASALEITLPPETATLKPSTLPGYQKALQNCTACHSAQYMQTQPASSHAWWTAEVHKMKNAYGAPIAEADMNAIADYMFAVYGPGKGADEANAPGAKPALAVATTADATTRTARADGKTLKLDAQALLKANNCLACHAVDHKVVGPAYNDVAARYAGKPDAEATIARHIREGGSGKWGPVPMPPFSNLTDAQSLVLASWIVGLGADKHSK
ncbi:MAG TPA: c-type cytochrome [Burkholderiaceae bacterium]|nr:c-type cytochrome [Burkholderiaceae bacterium]